MSYKSIEGDFACFRQPFSKRLFELSLHLGKNMKKEIEIINKILKFGFTREIMLEIDTLDGDGKYRIFRKLDDLHKNRYMKFKEELIAKRKGGL